MTYAQIFRKAANLIRKHGLAVGIRHASNGSMCAIGAIESAIGVSPLSHDDPRLVRLSRTLRLPMVSQFCQDNHAVRVAQWSNHASADIVIAGFRRAAKRLTRKRK